MKPACLNHLVSDAAEFGRVAVLYGGDSAEREVSLDSGAAVLSALQQQGIDATGVDGIPALLTAIGEGSVDRVFNVLHGAGGEDGVLQGLLEACHIPVTGSGVLGSALAMDKIRSKQIWRQLNMPTADFIAVKSGRELHTDQLQLVQQWLPVVVKPNEQGSTVGISIVRSLEELPQALAEAGDYDSSLIIEAYIEGDDYTVAFVQQSVFPSLRIRPQDGFYDYHSKYQSNTTRYDTNTLSDDQEAEIRRLTCDASLAVGVSGWGRADFMRDRDGNNWLLEVNTVPGMTSHSLVPKAAQADGCNYDQLVWAILETSIQEQAK